MNKFEGHDKLNEIFSTPQIFEKISENEAMDLYRYLSEVKVNLILDLPFFGYLLSNISLVITQNTKLKRFSIDSKFIYFQEAYLRTIHDEKRIKSELKVDFIHLILHFIYQHNLRQKQFDPKIWSLACDIVIYQAIHHLELEYGNFKDSRTNFINQLPSNLLSLSSEKVYKILLDNADNPEINSNNSQTSESTETDFQRLLNQLNLSNSEICDLEVTSQHSNELISQQMDGLLESIFNRFSRDDIPNFIQSEINDRFLPKRNWRTELSLFLQNTIIQDTTWIHPNKRLISRNLYLPSKFKENLSLMIALDTSQSIEDSTLSKFVRDTTSIIDTLASVKLTIVQSDAAIQSISEFDYGETPKITSLKGRGGTDFRPVFNLLSKYDVDLLIYFTDGDGIFPSHYDLSVPVLWVLTQPLTMPFGQSIMF